MTSETRAQREADADRILAGKTEEQLRAGIHKARGGLVLIDQLEATDDFNGSIDNVVSKQHEAWTAREYQTRRLAYEVGIRACEDELRRRGLTINI